MKIKNTTRVLYDLIQNSKQSKKNIVENTGLSTSQVTNTIKFLKRGGLINVEYIKTDSRPYRKAKYFINSSRYKYVLNLISRRLKDAN